VPTESLCEQLLDADDGAVKARLMDEAAASPECLDYLLATARQQTGANPPEAGRRAAMAIALAERSGDLRAASAAWRIRAQAHRGEGAHIDAAAALETASSLALQAGDALLAAQSLIGRVDSLGWLGRYDEALALARRLETELRARNSPEDAAKVLVNLGSLYYRRDQYRPALECYERALEALAQAGDPVTVARVEANTATVLMEINRVEEAVRLFEHARNAFASAGLTTATAMVDANIGFLHYISGKHSAAVAALTRARQEFAQRGQTLEAAKCEADMAEAYRELNLHPEALDAYESAIRHFESVSVDYERARAEMGRAAVLMTLARFDEALQGLDRAETLFLAHKNSVRVAHVRLLRALMLFASGQTGEAETEARRAASTLSRHRLQGWAAEARFLVADAALRIGTDATRTMQAVGRVARTHARGWLEARAESALGRYYSERGEITRALKHFRGGVNALEMARTQIAPEEMHVAFLRDKLTVYEYLVAGLLTRGRPRDIAEALEVVERAKSRLLLERVQAALEGRTIGPATSPEMEARLGALRAELSRGYHRLNALDEGEARRLGTREAGEANTLVTLERAYRAMLQEAELADIDSSSVATPLPAIVGAATLQAALQPNEALIEFYVVQEQVCAFIVTARRVRILRNISSLTEVTFNSRRLRFQLQRAGSGGALSQRHARRFSAEARDVLARLYDLLLRPLEEILTAEKIVLIPYASLHGLPFHAFYDGTQYALERWECVYAPSAAIWYESARHGNAQEGHVTPNLPAASESPYTAKTPEFPNTKYQTPNTRTPEHPNTRLPGAQRSALLMGVPDPGIEMVAEEVDRLAALLPQSRVLRGQEATLAAFHAHASDSRLIHLATHALYRADNPLFSGLRFADGWLLARDLYEMKLDCDLATLSACQTGVTFVEAGDELFGLQRGFLAAGARSVAASLWLADDAATAALMEQFYSRLAQGMSKAAALRAAQRHTLRQYPHPYHWAAFILIGER
jgi:CHAT domain-containing protein